REPPREPSSALLETAMGWWRARRLHAPLRCDSRDLLLSADAARSAVLRASRDLLPAFQQRGGLEGISAHQGLQSVARAGAARRRRRRDLLPEMAGPPPVGRARGFSTRTECQEPARRRAEILLLERARGVLRHRHGQAVGSGSEQQLERLDRVSLRRRVSRARALLE